MASAHPLPRRSAIAVVVTFVLVAALAVVRRTPPAPRGPAPGEFSAVTAQALLASVLADGAPHPTGSAANVDVRSRIAATLTQLGYAPEEQSGSVCRRCPTVTNVLARLPGTGPGKAVLLTAHYDSVPGSPGAADDGGGVAVVLEVARLLREHGPLVRPVLFLLTDGEEWGLLGAQLFAASAAFQEVEVVVNLDARGASGPSLLFEISEGNGALVDQVMPVLPHPVTASLFPTVYRYLPNRTDFSVYLESGAAGLNFAFIGDGAVYHSASDDLAHLSPATLQHLGDQVLAVTRALGEAAPEALPRRPDSVFFDVLSLFVLRWPASWMVPLAAVALAASVGAVAQRVRRAGGKAAGRVAGLAGLSVLGLVLPPLLTLALVSQLEIQPSPQGFFPPSLPVYASGAHAVALLTMLGLAALAARRAWDAADLSAAVWLLWSLFGLGSAAFVPGASYLFVVPALLAGTGLVTASGAGLHALISAAPLVATAVLWAPVASGIGDAVGVPGLPVVAVVGAFTFLPAAPVCARLLGGGTPKGRESRSSRSPTPAG